MNKIAIGVVGDVLENKVWVTVRWIAEVKARAQVGIWNEQARNWASSAYQGEWKDPVPGLWYEHTFQLTILPDTKKGTYNLWAVVLDVNVSSVAEDWRDIKLPGPVKPEPEKPETKKLISWGWIVAVIAGLFLMMRKKK